jgi:hypothetical protein
MQTPISKRQFAWRVAKALIHWQTIASVFPYANETRAAYWAFLGWASLYAVAAILAMVEERLPWYMLYLHMGLSGLTVVASRAYYKIWHFLLKRKTRK